MVVRSEATPFRTFDIGWLVGIDGGWLERSFAERPGPNFGVVVGGDGGIACALEKTERGKSACGLLTREFQQNDKHCA